MKVLGAAPWKRRLRLAPALGAIGLSGALFLGPSGAVASLRPFGGTEATSGATSAYASAELGQLTLSSGVLLERTDARFLAGWSSPAASCRATRRVVIDATLTYSPLSRGTTTPGTFRLHQVGEVANCGESGPNFGVSFSASAHHLLCSGGRWLPGRYTLSATAIVTAPSGSTPDTTLRAVADLTTEEAPPCP